MAMDGDRKSGGKIKIEGERSKAWQLWRVGTDGSEIELLAGADPMNFVSCTSVAEIGAKRRSQKP
jgi:hypothetical protein